jgi:hypothetical protein
MPFIDEVDPYGRANRTWKQRLLDHAIFGFFLVLVLFGPVFCLFGPEVHRIERHKHRLATAPNLRELATACLELSVAAKEHPELSRPELDSLPKVIRDVHPNEVLVDQTGEVTLAFGGGFDHYGYRLERVPDHPEEWRFGMYYEEPLSFKELLRLGVSDTRGGESASQLQRRALFRPGLK